MGLKARTPSHNALTIAPDRLDTLRAICLSLNAATEKVAWGDPTWRIKSKIFAMQKGNYPGGRPSVWFKAEPGAQAMLVGADRRRFFVPPYVGHKGWVGVFLDTERVDWNELEHLIGASYELIRGRPAASR